MKRNLAPTRISNWSSKFTGWEVWVFAEDSFTVLTGPNAGEIIEGSAPAPDSPAQFKFTTELDVVTGDLIIKAGFLESTTDSDRPEVCYVAYLVNPNLIGPRMLPFGSFSSRFSVTPDADTWVMLAERITASVDVPPAPLAPIATIVQFNEITLAFSPPSGAQSAKIYRSGSGGSYELIASGVRGSSYVDNTAAGSTAYIYKIKGTNGGGDSALSPASNSVTTPTAPVIFLEKDSITLDPPIPVAYWPPTLGAAASQVTVAKRPTYAAPERGEDEAVIFDGVDDKLDFAEQRYVSAMIVLAKHDFAGLNNVSPIFLGHPTAFDLVGWSGSQLLDPDNASGPVLNGKAWLDGIEFNPRFIPKSLTEYGVYAFKFASPIKLSTIGQDRTSYWFKGGMKIVALYYQAPSDAELIAESQLTLARENQAVLPLGVFVGDSITASAMQLAGSGWWHGAIQGGDAWPAKLVEELYRSSFGPLTFVNVGKGGRLTGDILSVQGVEVLPLLTAARPHKFACIMIGTNDILGGWAAATSFANLVTYCQNLKAAGCEKVFVATIPSNGSNEAIRLAYNALILAGNAAYDGVADLAGDSRLSDNSNLTYFQGDEIHLNAAGQKVVKSNFLPLVYSAYGITPPARPAPKFEFDARVLDGHADNFAVVNLPSAHGPSFVKGVGSGPLIHYRTNRINGLPSIMFNSPRTTEDPSYLDMTEEVSVRTITGLIKFNSAAAFGGFVGLLNDQQNVLGTNQGYVITGQNGTTKLGWGETNPFQAAYRDGARVSFAAVGHDFAPLNTWFIFRIETLVPQTIRGRIGWAFVDATRIFDGEIAIMRGYDAVFTDDQGYAEDAEYAALAAKTIVQE